MNRAKGRFGHSWVCDRFLLLLPILLLSAIGTPTRADTVKLANGDVLTGEVVTWAVDHLVLEHPQLGTIRLPLDQLAIDKDKPPTRGLFNTRFLRGWTRKIELGVTGEAGNTNTLTASSGVDLRYRDEFKRWEFDGRSFLDVSGNSVKSNNFRLTLRRDWLLPESRWFAFAGTRYQFDQKQSWKNRNTFTAGPAYNLVETDAHDLDVLVSPAYTREWSGDNENRFEGLLGFDYTWKVMDRVTLEAENNFFVNVGADAGEVRNFTTVNLEIEILDAPELSLNLGAENEYLTDPAGDDENYDLKYYMTLGLGF